MSSRLSKLIINAAFGLLVFVSLLLLPASFALAADAIKFTPQVAIPGFATGAVDVGTTVDGKVTSDLLARYIKAIYDYGLKAAGILAAVILMGGGLLWLTSAGNESKIGQAKEMIIGSISGLVVLFSAWLILNTVNPALLNLTPLSLTNIDTTYGCCQYSDKAEMTTSNKCADAKGTLKVSETNSILNKTTNYAVSADGKTCTMPGCCITDHGQGLANSLCINTMESECDLSKSTFVGVDCQLAGGQYNCTMFDKCATTEDGGDCFTSPINTKYFCYNKICWEGDGKLNEPCGTDQGATCKAASTCAERSLGGRNCDTWGIACCQP